MPTNLGELTLQAVSNALSGAVAVLPNIIAALVIIILGTIVAMIIKGLVIKILDIVQLEKLLVKTNLPQAFKAADTTVTKFLANLINWFIIIIFLIPAVDLLGLQAIGQTLNAILLYIPNVIVAVVILLIGAIFAKVGGDFVVATATSLGSHVARSLSTITKWAIWIFVILAALSQLGIAADLIRIMFTGFVAMLALAGGLAFGLGGQEAARELMRQLKRDFSQKE